MKAIFLSTLGLMALITNTAFSQKLAPGPEVIIQTKAPGFSAEEVELVVTIPLEEALKAMPGVHLLRSQSAQALSTITIVFPQGTDASKARLQVYERLNELDDFPKGVKVPRLKKQAK
jgi:Cu/Ag efflux pump CusA